MKKYTQEELKKILSKHMDWLNGRGGSPADLSDTDLRYADLSGANLSGANLSYTNLRSADLSGANLSYTNLSYTNLRYTDLRYANLSYTDLSDTDLRYTDLRGANLRYANLRYTNLSGANLSHTDLSGAKLDYSSWPLWRGGLHAKIDDRIARQLAYHFCAQDCDSPDYHKARAAILSYANGFHGAKECGTLDHQNNQIVEREQPCKE